MVGVLILCGLCLLLVYYLLKPNPLDAIPGPKAWPLIGNVHQLDVDKLFVHLSDLGKQFGGIYRLKLFTRSIVVVSDYGMIHDVLVKQSRNFAGRYNSYRGTILKESLSGIVSMDAGPELSARRKTVQAYVKQYGSGIQKIEDVTQTAMDDLIRQFGDVSGDRAIDVRDYMISTTLDIISILLVGEVAETRDRETLRDTMDLVVDAMSPANGMLLDIFPFARHLGNNNYKQFQELIRRKDEFVNKWFGSQPNEGFIHVLQSMPEDEQRSKFLENLSPKGKVAFEFFLAGTFTTSTTTTVLMNVLCQYPEVQEKLRQEIFQVIGPSRYPTLKDQEAMPYLRATILEIGRFLTVAPLAVPHKAMKTCQLDRYTIPEGVEVWVNLWALHHDEQFWEEPFQFRPERYLDAEGQLVPADHPNRRRTMPFGAGVRVCVGEVFAVSRMFLIIARILQNFSILPETTVAQQPSCDPRDMKMGIALLPPEFKVRIARIDEKDN